MQLPGSSSLLNSLPEIQTFNGYQCLKIKRKSDASHIALERPTLSLGSPTKRTARMLPIEVARPPRCGGHSRLRGDIVGRCRVALVNAWRDEGLRRRAVRRHRVRGRARPARAAARGRRDPRRRHEQVRAVRRRAGRAPRHPRPGAGRRPRARRARRHGLRAACIGAGWGPASEGELAAAGAAVVAAYPVDVPAVLDHG
jgi:hypothetical protein